MTDETNNGRQPRGMLVLRTVAMPKDANPNGDIFGGWILAQMDLAGGLMAKQVAGSRTVTVTIDKMVFKRPVHVGDTIGIYAELLRVGSSSMDVQLEVWAKALLEDYAAERHLVTEGLFRYVSIDEHRRPRRIPDNPQFFTRSGGRFERQVDDRPGK
jgi:acyl-CoA thioesterase YciA